MKVTKDFFEECEIELTSTCNLKCPLCARNTKEANHLVESGIRPLKDIIKQLDEYPNLKMCCLAGILSEPTLYDEFFGLIEYMKSRNIKIELYTNATTHNEDYWYKVGQMMGKEDRVFFTICGSTQELHEKYRVGSDLSLLLKHHDSFKLGCKYKCDCIQHIMFAYNELDFYENMSSIRSLFSYECNIDSLPYRYRNTYNIDIDSDIDMREPIKSKYILLSKQTKIKHYFVNRGSCAGVINCKSRNEKFISFDNTGIISPCFLWRINNGDWDMDYGDILKFKYEFCYECEKNMYIELERIKGLDIMT